eukprot:123919-Pelagomonas_calceolata.AAC.2
MAQLTNRLVISQHWDTSKCTTDWPIEVFSSGPREVATWELARRLCHATTLVKKLFSNAQELSNPDQAPRSNASELFKLTI